MIKWLFWIGIFCLPTGWGIFWLGDYVFNIYTRLSWPIAAINSTVTIAQIVGIILMVLGTFCIIMTLRTGNAESSGGR